MSVMARPDPHVVIVGGGFAGLWATRALASAKLRITLVDRGNHHLFQPLLYQVATAGLSAPDIAAPLRHILRKQKNVEVRMAAVSGIDAAAKRIALDDGGSLDFDFLLLASGATHAYFGNDHWARHAPGLKTLDDALDLRRKLLLAFERAEAATDPAEREAWLSFAIVGGGPTGVELAGTLVVVAKVAVRKTIGQHEVDDLVAPVRRGHVHRPACRRPGAGRRWCRPRAANRSQPDQGRQQDGHHPGGNRSVDGGHRLGSVGKPRTRPDAGWAPTPGSHVVFSPM